MDSEIGAYVFEEHRDGLKRKKEKENKKALSPVWLIWLLSGLGKTSWKEQWCSGAPTRSQKTIVNTFSQIYFSKCHIGSMKSSMVRIYTQWKSAKPTNLRSFLIWESWFINVHNWSQQVISWQINYIGFLLSWKESSTLCSLRKSHFGSWICLPCL